MSKSMQNFLDSVENRNPDQPEFLQAVTEVVESLWDFIKDHPHYMHAKVLDRIVEPERVVMFRVPWRNDKGDVEINRGFRVEFNSAIGP